LKSKAESPEKITISSEEAPYSTARDYFSPASQVDGNGAFNPRSQDIRDLCPRKSSVKTSKTLKASISSNATTNGADKGRRGKALAEISAAKVSSRDNPAPMTGTKGGNGEKESCCEGCEGCKRDVKTLRAELASMKVEMLAMKMVMRQNGLRR